MKISILQPSYLPWPGYFYWMYHCELFVFLDDVNYTKDDWRNRNRIKAANGIQWLTVPVLTKGKFGQTIADTRINNSVKWRKKHWRGICQNYCKAQFFKKYEAFLRDVYEKPWEYLAELNIYLMMELSKIMGFTTAFARSSDLSVGGEKTKRLLNICKKMGATEYISGARAKSYMEEALFRREEIKITYMDYSPVAYPQLQGEFVPYLSILDLMFNCGNESILYFNQNERD